MIKVKVFFQNTDWQTNRQAKKQMPRNSVSGSIKAGLSQRDSGPFCCCDHSPIITLQSPVAVNCLLLTCELYILQHFIVEFPLSVGVLKKENFSDLCSLKYITCCSERLRIHFTALSYRQNCKTRQVTGIVFS